MTIFKRIKNKAEYLFLKKIRPEIIGGYLNNDRTYFPNIGISNLTHISTRGNNLNIGESVFIGHFNYIDGYNAKVTICKNVQITNYVNILTHSSHNSIRLFGEKHFNNELYPDLLNIGEIFIGENSYIGPHSVIMPNTTIGKGCIVSAYSYVKGNFPDFSLIRGIPAKVMGDTRVVDQKFLQKFPELFNSYYLKDEIN